MPELVSESSTRPDGPAPGGSLVRLRLGGWRSVSLEHPLDLSLAQTNVLIGPNNVGKSNITSFLVQLAEWCRALSLGQMNDAALVSHDFQLAESDVFLQEESGRIEAALTLRQEVFGGLVGAADLADDAGLVTVNVTVRREDGRGNVCIMPLLGNRQALVLTGKDPNTGESRRAIWCPRSRIHTSFDDAQNPALGKQICERIFALFVPVPALRHPGSKNSNQARTLLERLRDQRDSGKLKRYEDAMARLRGWLRRLLREESVELELAVDDLQITLQRGDGVVRFQLQSLGDGVAQLVYLLGQMVLDKADAKVLLIDEPEAHLHPGAVVELLAVLREDLSGVQTIAATHSTALVDTVAVNGRLFRCRLGRHGGTEVEPVDARNRMGLLDDLGVRPSHLFCSNCVVWVEGPIDIVYFRALLREAAPSPVAVEGRDFSFVVYGGSAGKRMSFDPDNDQATTNLLNVSVRSIVVADRDSDDPADVPQLVERLRREAQAAGLDPGRVLMPPGRETESLLRPEVFRASLDSVAPRSLRFDDLDVVVTYGDDTNRDPQEGRLGKWHADAADFTCPEGVDSETVRDRIEGCIRRKKSKIAQAALASDRPFSDEALEWARNELAPAILRIR